MLRRAIRTMLPARMHNALRRVAHTRRLNRVPVMTVDVAPLPKAAEISDMLRSDGMVDDWEKAETSIRKIFEDMPGVHAMKPESCRGVYHLIRVFQPRSVLEIGTNRGTSTLHAAMAMAEYRNAGRTPRLVTVDMFDVNNPATAEAKQYRISTPPRKMLARLDCADMVEFAIARSTDFLNGCETEFDFILLDHAPAADIAYRDIALAIRALRPGGQLLIHRDLPGGIALRPEGRINSDYYLATRRLRREGANLVALPLGAPPWPTKPCKSNLTGLVLLARE